MNIVQYVILGSDVNPHNQRKCVSALFCFCRPRNEIERIRKGEQISRLELSKL